MKNLGLFFFLSLMLLCCSQGNDNGEFVCSDEKVISEALREVGYFNNHYRYVDSVGVVVTKRLLRAELLASPEFLNNHFELNNAYYSICAHQKGKDCNSIRISDDSKLNDDFTVLSFRKLDSLDGVMDENVSFSFIELSQVYRDEQGKFYFELTEKGHTHSNTSYFGTIDSCRIKVDSTHLNFIN